MRNHFLQGAVETVLERHCVTTRSSSYLYHASWQSWIHSNRWTLLFLQRPEPETMEDKKKLCCLYAAYLQWISVSKTTCIIC